MPDEKTLLGNTKKVLTTKKIHQILKSNIETLKT